VVTDEPPSLQTLWRMRSGFKSKNYGIASQAHLRREDSRLRCVAALERLYLVAALALLYATTQGMSVQIAGFASSG